MGPLLIPAITGVAGLIGSIISQRKQAQVAKRNTDLQNLALQKQSDLAYTRAQENITEMNKYNSPQEQMNRFTQAGLNKNLIYSQGTPGLQSQIAHYSPANIQYHYTPKLDFGKALETGMNAFALSQNIKNSITQGKILEAENKVKQVGAEFARTLKLNEVHTSNALWNKLERDMAVDFNEFSQFFEPKAADYGGNYWSLIPGMEKTFVEWAINKYSYPVLQSKNLTQTVESQKLKNEQLQKINALGIAVPALAPLMSFISKLLL